MACDVWLVAFDLLWYTIPIRYCGFFHYSYFESGIPGISSTPSEGPSAAAPSPTPTQGRKGAATTTTTIAVPPRRPDRPGRQDGSGATAATGSSSAIGSSRATGSTSRAAGNATGVGGGFGSLGRPEAGWPKFVGERWVTG